MTTMTASPASLAPEQVEQFMNLLNRLSPENLYADGERTHAAAKRIERVLKAQWKSLEADLGRTVTEDEIWAAFLTTPRGARVAHRWGA
jgi:hypothetical protein